MKVVLFDLDITSRRRPYPNLALMKLSAYHKARGDDVFLNSPLYGFDKAYASCVFTWNSKRAIGLPENTIIGGPGIDLVKELPPEVEHIMPDYYLYFNVDSSMGFTSRGCIRKCPPCIVPEKEGKIKAWASIYEFWDRRHEKITLFDNNLLVAPNWRNTFVDLIAERVEVDFNQGLDIRLVNDENVAYLKRLNAKKLRFAFDDLAYETSVRRGIELLVKNGIRSRKLSFYVLVGFEQNDQCVERMKILASYNVEVYPMLYKGKDGKEPKRQLFVVPQIFWHGSRRNINKFLRIVGRLPE